MLQVEKPCSRLITSSPKDGTLTEPITPARHDLGSHRSSPSLASTRYPGAEPAIPSAWPKRDIDSVPEEPEARSTANCTAKPLNAEARLKHALDKVLHLKRENLEEQTATLDYRVPPEISKACLDNFCKHYQVDIFRDFINIKLMYQILCIIDVPEISVDPAALILYYSILYHGSLTILPETTPQVGDLAQAMYVHCLRAIPAWQKQASGTKTDVIIAILLMRAAFQQYDFEFSWSIYKLVWHYIRKLDMHNLDQTFPGPFMDPKLPTEGADQHRMGFWALVLVDIFFRLLQDKPAVITANIAEWRVNLPSIKTTSELAEHVVPTLTFFVKSRLTFLLLGFFDMLSQNAEDKSSVIKRIEELCKEIEALFQEWSVTDSMAAYEDNAGFWWMLYDLTLTAYCSMMVMSRELAILQSGLSGEFTASGDVPITPLSVNIARRIMHLTLLGLGKYPSPAAACCVFGTFRCYVAYGCLAEHLFTNDHGDSGSTAKSDMVLLDQVSQKMAAIAERDQDLVPVVLTLYELNSSIHAKWKRSQEAASL
ncbi:hypothetical protein BGZ61DRAFT_338590 [Ilyonectria robusta]|uniref:uncharacterized protein n=1 Tax=Ilyonectria robusta TaxID=1079257 RepID=UPI001E8CDFE4|nr:uncharacterized protein BGZ61DRAFT_338590 [Ilyonectria robusta]KAH8738470.1 hypothetical protein BGZ61DRAFT_338590 [Ilyonectria robusta]